MSDKNGEKVKLFEETNLCSACGACKNVCPRHAVSMEQDKSGFLYPEIDYSLCVGCGRCRKVCKYQKGMDRECVQKTYAAVIRDKRTLLQSASGGVFAELARQTLDDGGVVYGVALLCEKNTLIPKHICVSDLNELPKLQGSKYVQSDIGMTYCEAERELKRGNKVLFSGTPCQIAGLKGFLGEEYSNLITVDIICHGVPSAAFFQSYIDELMKKWKGSIIDFKFREKSNGWGLNAKIIYRNKSGKIKERKIPSGASSYYDMFLKSEIYRENCYTCPYACKVRVGDLTLGDYWGIQREHPELLTEAGGTFVEADGISCILVNSKKGQMFLKKAGTRIELASSTLEKVSNENGQLNYPSQCPETREYILRLYQEKG